jgi:hypothetical protein
MKRLYSTATAALIVLVGITVTGCGEDPIAPRPAADLAPLALQDCELDVIASVSGNGHVKDGVHRDISRTINIVKYEDGSVEGWYHARGRAGAGAHIRARIECLHVVGNQAWASGTVVAAADPNNIGRPYAVRVIDNGEGANSMPDEVGSARFIDYDCATEPDISLRQLTTGNIVVRSYMP